MQCPKSPIFQLLQKRFTGSETKHKLLKPDRQISESYASYPTGQVALSRQVN